MPVTTRAQSQIPFGLLSTLENANSYLPSNLSTKTVVDTSCTTTPSNSIQNPIAFKKPRRPKGALSRLQKPQKRPRKHQSSGRSEQFQTATERSSPDLSDSTITHWACQTCSCPQGAFDYPIDACIRCGHEMYDHEKVELAWDPNCSYICERKDLVASIMRLLDSMRVVVIRATPQAGKSILLRLLGSHVLYQRRELEPVFIDWDTRAERKHLPYDKYLEREKSIWRERNAECRPCNPKAKTLYLIDEAQESYEEKDFWTRELKNRDTRSQPMFVLVCLYGADVSIARLLGVESKSLNINSIQRVELRPSNTNNPYLLFTLKETATVVQKWAMLNKYQLESGIYEYLHAATDGHPGMVGFVLGFFDSYVLKSTEAVRRCRLWTPKRCHEILVDHTELISELTTWGRGLWTTKAEGYVKMVLKDPRIPTDVTFSGIVNALRQVAIQPHGYTPENRSDVFELCNGMGYLHKQQLYPGSEKVTYTFASPIHRRVAYRRLCPGPEPGRDAENLTLQQTCLNAIERFSPSTLQSRSMQSCSRWGIPEAAFQDELYCALSYELQNLPILSEYSPTRHGRVDFYVFDKKWGIEVLQCGSKTEIVEHAGRFAAGGKYREWNIFEDYIILNFCSKSTVRNIEIEDVEIQSHILQVAVDSNEYTAEVYTYDKRLQATLSLGEGRQRFHADKYDLPSGDSDALKTVQNRLMQMERQAEQEKEDLRRQMEQEKDDLRRQMEQVLDDMKRQTRS